MVKVSTRVLRGLRSGCYEAFQVQGLGLELQFFFAYTVLGFCGLEG